MPGILVGDDEVFTLSDAQLRFREACQFYLLFLQHGGPAAAATGNRFLWVCYADAFLMAVATLKDLSPTHKAVLNADDRYRLIVTLRNLTVHSIVAGSPGAGGVISRDVYARVGNMGRDNEDPVISADKLNAALTAYEARLRAEPMGRRTRWDAERRNVEAAQRWSANLAAATPPRRLLSDLFLETLTLVAGICGFAMPSLP